jgi:catechol 2,3-dioxygenase-like lactoylglutathione lyase family enzyme
VTGHCIKGLYEATVGVPDLDAALAYCAAHGFTKAQEGRLGAREAAMLYGVESDVVSWRLGHLDSDHGLVRLMRWDRPLAEGLGMTRFRVEGSRWGAMMTRSAYAVMNHVEAAQKQGWPIDPVPPVFASIYQKDQVPQPFAAPLLGVREMALVQPLARQVYFERFGYDNALYGKVAEDSLMRTSQITHFGMVIRGDDHGVLDFYDRVLGLKRTADTHVPYEQTVGSRLIFDIPPGEPHWLVDFDDPRSGETLQDRRSGRLKILRFPAAAAMPDGREQARAGCPGHGNYTWRCDDAAALRARVMEGGATGITALCTDEFGQPAFSCQAPDGYWWTFIEDASL